MTKNKNALKTDFITYYFQKHRTTQFSEELTEKGSIEKYSYCNARIAYIKSKKNYYINWGHSSLYNRDIKTIYENLGDIDTEVDKYKNFRLALTNYLDKYPMIPINEFKKRE